MKLQPVCITCLINQVQKLLKERQLPTEEEIRILKEVTRLILELDSEAAPPVYGRELHLMVQKYLEDEDPYFPQKKMSNDNALKLLPRLREEVEAASDPLSKSIQIAISGNIIDYGAPGSGTIESIEESLNDTLSIPLDKVVFKKFKEEISAAGNILYVGDNAGEIVFDRLLIDAVGKTKITFAVRGKAILNDATREDINYTGIFDGVDVIDTGDSTPGVEFDRSSAEFLEALSIADMVILKGQGNFETLYGTDTSGFTKGDIPFYYLFKVKCEPVAEMTGIELGSIAFLKD